MTRRAGARSPDGQLSSGLHDAIPPAVERSRAFRRASGLPESLTAPETLAQVWAILEVNRYAGRPDVVSHREAS